MKLRILTLLGFFVSLSFLNQHTAQAQYTARGHRETSTVIKLPISMSPIPRLMVGAAVEMQVGEGGSTFQAEIGVGLPTTVNKQNLSVFQTSLQYRYYFKKYEAFEGFYAGAHIGFTSVAFEGTDVKTNARFSSVPAGLVLGYQIPLSTHWLIDINAMPGFSPGSLDIGFGRADDFDIKPYNSLYFKTGIGVAYGF
jgi:hypothetical protein